MTGCSQPPLNANCSDPAYRDAHPDECSHVPVLLLIPENSIIEPGKTIPFKVILRANGVELELLQGLEFSSSNEGVAVVNVDGLATGVTAGHANISVTWQDLSAVAQIEVVADCAETNQHFAIVIDNSKSMGQGFSSQHATKLAFSKQAADAFIDTINLEKDDVSVWKFNDLSTELITFGTDPDAAQAAVQGIAVSTGKTDLATALSEVIESFPADDGVRAIVLFSDGQYSGDDPLPIAREFKESGGFLIIVAVRAWGDGFIKLAEMSSGGFLLSAYGNTENSIIDWLSGLKSLVCAGSCEPGQNEAPYAELNYVDFINWDVTQGRVDLVGLDRWDVQPEHGLYVDLQGTGDEGYPSPGQDFGLGQITSKLEYDFEDGKDYRFSLKVGGSSRGAGTWTIRIRVGDGVDEEVTITDAATPFAEHEFEWTQSGDFTGPIIIEQTVQTGHHNIGTLIDDVLLENVTDVETMLEDNFDSENPTTIPPSPGNYGGCATIEPQTADPNPPPILEE